jgi:hypothetical protein
VFLDLEDPLCIEAFVEPLNHGAAFDVIQHVSIRDANGLSSISRFIYTLLSTRSCFSNF